MEIPADRAIAGADLAQPLDALFVNAPLRDYSLRPRTNDFTLPVLGMGYIATYAASQGFNVGIIDAEALGLGVDRAIGIINEASPRWACFNLLAPTYEISARIAAGLDAGIQVMAGGHQAKAMPAEVLADLRFARLEALVLGEGETRVAELLKDRRYRFGLPGVMWLDPVMRTPQAGGGAVGNRYLAPDIDALPFVDRRFLADDPCEAPDGRYEANMVGARGCPYDCSFCGAAVSANPDITIRTRDPENIIAEMDELHARYGVTAFRFVDDLFLGYERFIRTCMAAFSAHDIGGRYVWDATGRINILHRADDKLLDELAANGLREVALGIESGSERLLKYMGKRITPDMTRSVVDRLVSRGISVKGYFILGFPTETRAELAATVRHVYDLWRIAESQPGCFRASVFEFRPYPGTPEWQRLLATGQYETRQLLDYTAVDLTHGGLDEAMRGRDEFNFSVNIQFGEASVSEVRERLIELSREQYQRSASRARERAEKRGLYSRFHRGGQVVSMAEAALYATVAVELAEHGFAVLTHDIGTQTPGAVAETLAAVILARMQDQAGDA